MKNYGIALALLALTGCASTQGWVGRHPVATALIATSIALSVPDLVHQQNRRGGNEPAMSVPLTPDCAKFAELCR